MDISAAQLDPADKTARALVDRLRAILPRIQARAAGLDQSAQHPAADIRLLHDIGLLRASLPACEGGLGLGTEPAGAAHLATALRLVGRANLSLGRLLEGHVNGVRLVTRFGSSAQLKRFAAAVHGGAVSGIWNSEPPPGARLLERRGSGRCLEGAKQFASGAGAIERPLVTARDAAGGVRLVLLEGPLPRSRVDPTAWNVQGMRATGSGRVDLTGLPAPDEALIGPADAYFAQPDFAAGAWRFLAVQLGGLEEMGHQLRLHLLGSGRDGDALQRARFAELLSLTEGARLWVERAAILAEGGAAATDTTVAYVALARHAVEHAATRGIQLVQRSIGTRAFFVEEPVERISRDLAFYLRQPAPDRALDMAAGTALAAEAAIGDLWATTAEPAGTGTRLVARGAL